MIDTIKNFLESKYDGVTFKELSGGYTNKVFLLENIYPLLTAKIYSDYNNLTETICLNSLSDFKWIPKVNNIFKFDESTILISEYINGVNGQYYLDENNLEANKKFYILLGEYLSKIHSIKNLDLFSNIPNYKISPIKGDDFKILSNNLVTEINKYFTFIEEDNYVFLHGDFGPHNTIISNNLLYIIDWELSGVGHPLLDISWTIWLLKFHYPNYADKLCSIFIDSYIKNSNRNLDLTKIKSYMLFKIITIINKIPLANLDAKDEWLKRLSWTLKTDFNSTI